MARMHSRDKGVSGSKRPLKRTIPSWIRYKDTEVEMLIAKMSKDGKTSSQIGMILRDTYGVPDVKIIAGKSITKILREKKLTPEVPEDLRALIKKVVLVRKHREENKQDMTALRGQQLTDAKINRLVKYYKRKGMLPVTWKYDPKKASTYLE